VGLVLVDLALRATLEGTAAPSRWQLKEGGVYLLGVIWSLSTWSLLAVAFARLRGRARRNWAIGIALPAGVVCALSFAYLASFEQAASWQVLNFAVAEPRHVLILAAWGLRPLAVFSLIALPAVQFWLLGLTPLQESVRRLKRWLWTGGLFGYAALSVLVLVGPGFQSPLPVDANAAAAVAQFLLATTGRQQHLSTPVREEIPAQPEGPRPSVLLLIHESLRADVVFPGLEYRASGLDARQISPYSARIAERRDDGYFAFLQARSDSTATESSVPSILSGIQPGGPSLAYTRAPSFWSLGKAAHLHTFLFSALDYEWSHFDEYFLGTSVDVVQSGRDISRQVVNDTGVDDGLVVERAIAHLRSLASEHKPFAGVIHFNGTHMPGYPGPGVSAPPARRGDPQRYGLAARYIDHLVERIDQSLDQLGLAESTVVIATSDHGENLAPVRPPDRLGSFYEETVRVPFWIRVPKHLLSERSELAQALDAWRRQNVQNSDVLPTVRDFIGLGVEPKLGPPLIPGRSLLRAPPSSSVVSGQSTCAFRVWNLEGFFALQDRIKIIVGSDQPSPRLFDLARDPAEQKNLWSDPQWRARVMPWLTRSVAAGEERQKLCARIPACPIGR
jgi:hypothetical protein